MFQSRALITSLVGALLIAVSLFLFGAGGKKVRSPLPENGWESWPPVEVKDESALASYEGRWCIVRTTAPAQVARDISAFVDEYLVQFGGVFSGKFKIVEKLKLRVLSTEDEFKFFCKRVYGTDEFRPAFYSPNLRETWVTLGGAARKMLPEEVLKHEFTHHMLHFFTGQERLPDWFNEGAACFFQYWDITMTRSENIEINLKRANGGYFGYFPRVIRDTFGKPEFLGTQALMGLSYDAFHTKEKKLEYLYYSESWALVNFLASTAGGKKFFSNVTAALRDGKELTKVLKPETYAQLEQAWYEDIRKRIIPSAPRN
ncbi:MAG: hypothetical protein L0Z55_01060 [Planctomycetes bacterium]|nr:hypothetical protein [Planctomycetota bacterium]